MKPPTGADPAFHDAAQDERGRMFPMAAASAWHHLRYRSYYSRPAILDTMVRQEAVKPLQPDA